MGLFKRIFENIGKARRCEFLSDKGKCVPPDKRTGPPCTYRGKTPKLECHVYPIHAEKLAFKQKVENLKAELGIREFRKRLSEVRNKHGSDIDAQKVLVAQELARSIPQRNYRKSSQCPLSRAKSGDLSGFDVVSEIVGCKPHGTFTKAYFPICHACKKFESMMCL